MAVGRWYRSGCIDTNTKVWLEERTQKLWNMVVAGAVCAGQGQIMRVLGPMVGCPKMYLGAIFLINQLINFWGCTESLLGFPDGTSSKEPACQQRWHKRLGFHLWVGQIPWRRAGQPTPVFLPGESHGQRKLAGYSPWDRKESDMTEATQQARVHTRVYAGCRLSLVSWSEGYSLACGLLIEMVSLVEHRLQAHGLQQLWSTDLSALRHAGSSLTRD